VVLRSSSWRYFDGYLCARTRFFLLYFTNNSSSLFALKNGKHERNLEVLNETLHSKWSCKQVNTWLHYPRYILRISYHTPKFARVRAFFLLVITLLSMGFEHEKEEKKGGGGKRRSRWTQIVVFSVSILTLVCFVRMHVLIETW